LHGAATWWIHCHVLRATCHIAGCKNSIRHIENHFFAIFYFFVFLKCSLGFDEWRLSYRLRYTCLFIKKYSLYFSLLCSLNQAEPFMSSELAA